MSEVGDRLFLVFIHGHRHMAQIHIRVFFSLLSLLLYVNFFCNFVDNFTLLFLAITEPLFRLFHVLFDLITDKIFNGKPRTLEC